VQELVAAGFKIIEVPLNSPSPFESIEKLAQALGDRALIGAGTVIQVGDVAKVASAGGRIIVMPHSDSAVISAAKAAGMLCVPGVATPTEAFSALSAGADGLKLFPAEGSPPPVLKAMLAVLPKGVSFFPVGGITPDNMDEFRAVGAAGFGLGSALYKPGDDAATVASKAAAFRAGWDAGTAKL
jgi:2-dehydro-3-deoxyphosphogalactonate aldolase